MRRSRRNKRKKWRRKRKKKELKKKQEREREREREEGGRGNVNGEKTLMKKKKLLIKKIANKYLFVFLLVFKYILNPLNYFVKRPNDHK